MLKRIFLGGLVFGLGCLLAFVFFFKKNHSTFEPITLISPKKINYPATAFSLEQAPSDSIRGQIKQITGEVLWQSRTATEPGQLTTSEIQQGEKLVTTDKASLTVEFASTSAVMMAEKTDVEIIQTLPINLVFNQLKGAAEYQVTGIFPVTIRCFNLLANVSQGLIKIETDDKTGEVVLNLQNGKATVAYNSPLFVSKVWQLEPGDVFVFDSNKRRGYFNASL